MPKKEFKTLSEKREELSEYLREQGLSNNMCENILRVVINQDKKFIKILKEEIREHLIDDYLDGDYSEEIIDKLVGEELTNGNQRNKTKKL